MTDMITDHVKLPGGVTAVLERPGARLVYEVAGDGPAVVLIHGFGLDMRMGDPQLGPLAARFRVVRYDCRGFGASGPLDPGVPYTHAGDLVALLDYLGIGDAVLVGLSFGGRVALQAALAAMVAGYPGQHWLGQDPHRETRRPIDVLEGIAVPALVAVGERDVPGFREMSAVLARRIPGAAYHVVADAGHMVTLEQPAAVNDLLTGFLQEASWTR
jgi:pimeloyl-ACP methyl ester carboxylesterase